jgi:hypothetical protein
MARPSTKPNSSTWVDPSEVDASLRRLFPVMADTPVDTPAEILRRQRTPATPAEMPLWQKCHALAKNETPGMRRPDGLSRTYSIQTDGSTMLQTFHPDEGSSAEALWVSHSLTPGGAASSKPSSAGPQKEVMGQTAALQHPPRPQPMLHSRAPPPRPKRAAPHERSHQVRCPPRDGDPPELGRVPVVKGHPLPRHLMTPEQQESNPPKGGFSFPGAVRRGS